jgi:hypothetical protein
MMVTRRIAALVLVAAAAGAACTPNRESAGTAGDAGDQAAPTTTTATVAPSTTTTASATLGPEAATAEFAACMRDQGIEIPDIRLDDQGRPMLDDAFASADPSSLELRGALATCASILTQSGALDLRTDPELQALIVEQLAVFSECMRDEGVTEFPDPSPGFDGTGSPFPLELIPLTDPTFQDAVIACQDDLGSLWFGG